MIPLVAGLVKVFYVGIVFKPTSILTYALTFGEMVVIVGFSMFLVYVIKNIVQKGGNKENGINI